MAQAAPPAARPTSRGRVLVLVGLALLVGLGVGRATADLDPWPAPSRPNIVLLTVDTLRADHLPFYGYHRDTAPFLASLAAEGVVFEHATSTSSWTSPSMASLVTSLYPHQHGVETTAAEGTPGNYTQPALSHEVTTLAERMKELGYGTYAVVTNLHVAKDLGFAQGFDHFENVGFSRTGEPVHDGVRALANRLRASEPWFLWIHLFDPHAPYRVAEPHASAFDAEAGTRFPIIAGQDDAARRRRLQRWSNRQIPNIEADEASLVNPIVVETLRTLYDSELRDSDEWIRRTFALLGLERDAVVLFTADHGEEFRDHGKLGHRNTLYDELTHVPLMIWSPERVRSGARVAEPASLVDVLPTLVEAAGGPTPTGIQGASLWSAAARGTAVPQRDLLLGVQNEFGTAKGMIRYPMKVVETYDGSLELYDLVADPGERTNLAPSRRKEAASLRESMHAAFAALPKVAHERAPVEASEAELLQELGYTEPDADEAPTEP